MDNFQSAEFVHLFGISDCYFYAIMITSERVKTQGKQWMQLQGKIDIFH